MSPSRLALALLLAAGLGVLVFSLGDAGSDTDDGGYGEETPGAPAPEDGLQADPGLKGSAVPPAAIVPNEPPGRFEIIARHATSEALLSDIRIDDIEAGFLGITDTEGRLVLERPAAKILFTASARNYLLSRSYVLPDRPATIYMTPGTAVKGVLRDAVSGDVVKDAALKVWDDDLGRFISGTVSTDEEGKFELDGVRLKHPFTIHIQVKKRVPVVSRHQLFDASKLLEVFVRDGGQVRGTLHAGGREAGVPIYVLTKGVRVPGDEPPFDPWKHPVRPGPDDADRRSWSTYRAVTDEEGKFEILGIPFDMPFTVVARLDRREQVRSKYEVLTKKRDTVDLELRTEHRGRLELSIQDERGLKPKGVTLRLHAPHIEFPLDPREAEVSRSRYRFEDIPVGTYTLIAHVRHGAEYAKPVKIQARQTTKVEIKTLTGVGLAGRVRGENGDPIARGRVTWRPYDKSTPIVRVYTDGAGRFELRGLKDRGDVIVEPAMTYEARARHRGERFEGEASGREGVEYRLEERPIIQATVFGPGEIPRLEVDVLTRQFRKTLHFKIGADGRFDYQGPPELPGLMIFRARDLAPVHIRFVSERQLDEKLARLWLPPARPIPVTVRAEGHPLKGARIRPADPRLRHVWRTDEKGEVDILGYPAEPTAVIVDAPFHKETTAKVTPSVAGKRTQIEVGGVVGILRGTVPSRYRGWLSYLVFEPRFRWKGDKKTYPRVRFDRSSGSFEIKMPPGRYNVNVHARGSRHGRRIGRVTIRAGERHVFD